MNTIEHAARHEKLPVTMPCSTEHPLWPVFCARGYVPLRNEPYIRARILRPDRIFARPAHGLPLLDELRLSAVTPHRDVVINDPPGPRHSAMLFLKESQLGRLRRHLGA